jgi:hypothetical protein
MPMNPAIMTSTELVAGTIHKNKHSYHRDGHKMKKINKPVTNARALNQRIKKKKAQPNMMQSTNINQPQ